MHIETNPLLGGVWGGLRSEMSDLECAIVNYLEYFPEFLKGAVIEPRRDDLFIGSD